MNNQNWLIRQRWSNVLFLNFFLPPHLITLPEGLEVDTFEGLGCLSIVPFFMSGVRFRWTPYLPFNHLWELNLRTYVKAQGQPGIYFYTLDSPHRLANWIARTFFHLPYRFNQLEGAISRRRYLFSANNNFKIEAKIGSPIQKDEKLYWVTERYSVFNQVKGQIWEGVVRHEPWTLHSAQVKQFENHWSQDFGFDLSEPHATYSPGLEVSFPKFKRL